MGRGSAIHPRVTCTQIAADLLRPHFEPHQHTYEAFRVLLMDSAMHCRGVVTIGQGGLSSTTADRRLVLSAALATLSTEMILAHNHPSGNAKPSQEDVRMTQEIIVAARQLGVAVVDHLIFAGDAYVSMASMDLLN